MARPDPFRAFRVRVEIDAVIQGGFRSVSGIERQTTIEPYREGGVNHFEHQLATKTTYPPLNLQRGLVDTALWDWHQEVINGAIVRRDVAISVLGEQGEEVLRLVCAAAYPSRWSGLELDATTGAIATESVEFVHHGITRQ